MRLKLKIGRFKIKLGYPQEPAAFPCEIMLPQSLTARQYDENKTFVETMLQRNETLVPQSCLCFLPYCPNLEAGGIKTIFLMLQALQNNSGTRLLINVFPPLDKAEKYAEYAAAIRRRFPELDFEFADSDKVEYVDIGLCTLWITAFELAKFNRCRQKYYLVQDYETLFYPSGSVAALVDETYKFGFYTLTNSQRLAEIVGSFSQTAVFRYLPGVDKTLYYPPAAKSFAKDGFQLVFYGRPSNPRNCFELTALICRRLKEALGEKIKIVSVGEDYSPRQYGLHGIVENRGRVGSMRELAELYRQSDLGISFITTPTFSYQHLEYMASGLCLITNEQPGISDFIRDGENAVVCPMIVDVVARRIAELIDNPKQMETLSKNAVKSVSPFKWNDFGKSLCSFIKNKKI